MSLVPSIPDLEVTAQALGRLHERALPGWSAERFRELVRPRARFSAEDMLEFCERCGLVEPRGDGWDFSGLGVETTEALAAGDWSVFASTVLRASVYNEELARLLEASDVANGVLRCPRVRLRRLAPTVGMILFWDPAHRVGDDLVVPMMLLEEALAISTMEQAGDLPKWVQDKHSVGWRAEMYSLRRERLKLGADQVLHISKDVGDGFGYDIEAIASNPSRLIEVKGSRGSRLSFVLTAKELSVAETRSEQYELQFWGGISLRRGPQEEFHLLSERGYPTIISDVAATLRGERWTTDCQAWRCTAPLAD